MSAAEHLLSQLVDSLVSSAPGGPEPVAYLVQKNRADAVVVLRSSLNALVLLADAPLESDLAERVQAALAAERPDVRAGVGEAARFLVVVGETVPVPEKVTIPGGVFEILGVSPDAAKLLAYSDHGQGDVVPESRKHVLSALDAARRRIVREAPVALSPETLARVEVEGEAALAAEGRFAGRLGHPFGVLLIIAACLIVYVVEMTLGAAGIVGDINDASNTTTLVRLGAMLGSLVRQGEWERVITAGYLHMDAMHLLTNMVILYIVGLFAEASLGPWRLIALYTAIIAGAEGAVAWLKPDQVGCGASGGVLGLMGALAVLSWRSPELVPPISGAGNGIAAGGYLLLQMLVSFRPGVSFIGHAAGAAMGVLIVMTGIPQVGLPPLRSGAREPGWSRFLGAFAALAALCITVTAFQRALERGKPWQGTPPPQLVEGTLTASDLKGRFPDGSVAAMEVSTGANFVKYQMGDYRIDPLVISIIDRDHHVPDADGAAAIEHLQGAIQEGKDPGRWTKPEVFDLGKRRAARCEVRRYGTNIVRVVFGVANREIDAQISWVAPATLAHEKKALECLQSLERIAR